MKKTLLLGGGIFVALMVGAYFFVPWKTIAQEKIIDFFAARGVHDVALEIESIGLGETRFAHIRIGAKDPITLQSIRVQYNIRDVLRRNLETLTLTGLDLLIVQGEEGWSVSGFGPLGKRDDAQDSQTSGLTLSDLVDLLPFDAIEIQQSYLRLSGAGVQSALPFRLRLQKFPDTQIFLNIDANDLEVASSAVSLGDISVNATQNGERRWQGTWEVTSVDLGDDFPVPVLKGEGTLNYTGETLESHGTMQSDDKTHRGTFSVLIDIADSRKNSLTLKSLSFPFKEGRVSLQNTLIPFDRSRDIRVDASVEKVSLNALLQILTGQKVSATGTLSGRIPVILHPDGRYTLRQGVLRADDEGIIHLPGDMIPGNHQQVDLVRKILENLHYSIFSAAVDVGGTEGLVVRLSLEGHNPDVYNGRAVKLNVNLTGDILDFIQQNAMLITNPERFLRQDGHE